MTETIVISIFDYYPDWWAQAECRTASPDVFFGNDSSTGRLNAARVFCSKCPVAGDCLRHALVEPERFGIWAGTSASARDNMLYDINNGAEVDVIVDYVLKHRFRWRKSERRDREGSA